MTTRKSLIAAGMVAGLALVAVGSVASAHGDAANGGSLVDKLSQRFNLNKDDVQKVFDEERTARDAEHEQHYEERLTQAVKDGKLTEEQKTKLLAKHKELKAAMVSKHDAMKDKTPEERHAGMKQHRADIETWASQNNVPVEYLMMHGPIMVHGEPGAGHGAPHIIREAGGR